MLSPIEIGVNTCGDINFVYDLYGKLQKLKILQKD